MTDAPVSYSVYSALSFYGARRGGELPGTWLVPGLGSLGHQPGTIRQTLFRMERSEELVARTEGRVKYYRLSAYARAEAEAGLAKILNADSTPWDGEWTLVQLKRGGGNRNQRERLCSILRAEGFAGAGPGLFVHPRDRSARLMEAARTHAVEDHFEVFRGRRLGSATNHRFVAALWNLRSMQVSYTRFLRRYGPLAATARGLPPEAAFIVRFAMVFDFLEAAWADPDFTEALLPRDWPGFEARRLAAELYSALLPRALTFADSITRSRP